MEARVLDLAHDFRAIPRVMDDWGFSRRVSGGGVKALFTGDSGTGKTLAAEVVASELGLPLLKVDLARVVSKWIGETEKHLDLAFSEAHDSHAVLFFDEAEALFGERGDVRHGTDRYANMEVSYLLQRLEDHGGVEQCHERPGSQTVTGPCAASGASLHPHCHAGADPRACEGQPTGRQRPRCAIGRGSGGDGSARADHGGDQGAGQCARGPARRAERWRDQGAVWTESMWKWAESVCTWADSMCAWADSMCEWAEGMCEWAEGMCEWAESMRAWVKRWRSRRGRFISGRVAMRVPRSGRAASAR